MHNLIIGSGPSAAGVALALLQDPSQQITVIDLGTQLDSAAGGIVDRMQAQPFTDWNPGDVARISEQPVGTGSRALPQKRAYRSDFPFVDKGQLAGFEVNGAANTAPISSAYGGFSNVWGAQIMPFSRSTFDRWPIAWDEIKDHYAAALGEVPLAAEEDDYAATFPLIGSARDLPPLAPRTKDVLRRYENHRHQLNDLGMTIGRARLAFRASDCVRCGLCMTGCPYRLIYHAGQTFDRLRKDERVTYLDRMLAIHVREDTSGATVTVVNQRSGAREELHADRVFVACGGFGSTRLAYASLPAPKREFEMAESAQFVLPFVSTRSTGDPRTDSRQFTLNQFNMLLSFDEDDYSTSQIHCYPHTTALESALPAILRARALTKVTGEILGRLTIGLGYLPSWASPPVRVQMSPAGSDGLPGFAIRDDGHTSEPLMLTAVRSRLKQTAKWTGLHPVFPAMIFSGPAKSYHFGASFPHSHGQSETRGIATSDRLGRVGAWERIHLVDGSVLPSVPSTTFTLTVMANAHRIATEAMRAHAQDPAR